ncbi:MAG: DUF4249 domain-containing protein [Cyclobacteriaceae bacterium]
MRNSTLTIIAVAFFSLTGCEDFFERDVEVDIPEHEPKLVMYSYIYPGDSIQIILSNSVGIEKSHDIWNSWISDAQVTVQKGDETSVLASLNVKDEYQPYFVAYPEINSGDRFRISASVNGYESVVAEVMVPMEPVIENAKFTGVRLDEEGEEQAGFNFKITDEKDADNFYEIIILNRYSPEGETPWFDLGAWNYSSFLPWMNESNPNFSDRLFFTDNAFKDGEITIDFLAGVWDLIYGYDQPDVELFLAIRSVSESYYEYVTTYSLHQGNQFPDLFTGEPVPMYTNVENGFGVFGAFSETRIKIDVSD